MDTSVLLNLLEFEPLAHEKPGQMVFDDYAGGANDDLNAARIMPQRTSRQIYGLTGN